VGADVALRRLAERFDIVWASAWSHNAHPALRQVLDLPESPWPFLPVQFHKLDSIRAFAAGRPWAWIDDSIHDLGRLEDGSTHLENRIGESAANPYLYMASQLHSGLEGVAARLPLGASADDPYTTDAGRLPANLAAAIDALEADAELTRAMGSRFVPYYAALKRAEIARFEQTVTDWEQREYFDLY
jgi:hypothetical protein